MIVVAVIGVISNTVEIQPDGSLNAHHFRCTQTEESVLLLITEARIPMDGLAGP